MIELVKSSEIARFAAIGKMYGCITTRSCRSYSEVVSGNQNKMFKVKPQVMSDTKNNRDKWLHIRLKEDEHSKINEKFSNSTCRKLSEYARRVLLDKAITISTRNRSLDDFMAEMIKLRTELNSIGNNFNQSVKKLHTLSQLHEFKSWIIQHENHYKTLLEKVAEIKNKINQISDKWLQ